mgnify:CR=1 FL=1
MSRSVKKGPYVAEKLLKKVARVTRSGSQDPIQTWSRASVVIPEFVGHTFMVHNGRMFNRVYVTENMVGHRLGEFSPTRTFRGHAGRRGEHARKA